MKPYLLILLTFLSKIAFAQNVTSPEEQDEIKQVIAEETKFYYARNTEKWANCYRQTPQTYWAMIDREGGTTQKEGWDNINAYILGYLKENPKPVKCTFKRENYNFRKVNPTYIWVTFDQTKTLAGKKDLSKETRILELIKSEWKIVNRTGFYMPTADKTIKDESLTTSKEKDKKEISGKDKKSSSEKDKKGIGEKVKSESSENEPKTKTRKKSEK